MPIDDEPHPFWNGAGAEERLAEWLDWLRPSPATHGTFRVPPNLNGPSGSWVDANVLTPLSTSRDQTWITDCLDTYRMSTRVEARINDTYRTAAFPECRIEPHPSETQIVAEALTHHRDRLWVELERCQPPIVVTLGNAAARVFASLTGQPQRQLAVDGYGTPHRVSVGASDVTWYPLAHPAAPGRYQQAHTEWVETKKEN